jgi:hypothetical protein
LAFADFVSVRWHLSPPTGIDKKSPYEVQNLRHFFCSKQDNILFISLLRKTHLDQDSNGRKAVPLVAAGVGKLEIADLFWRHLPHLNLTQVRQRDPLVRR